LTIAEFETSIIKSEKMEKMKFSLQKLAIYLSAVFLIASTVESGAFALLGPVQPWMQTTNGVISIGDIGGPMCIINEYRWNVPVVTYGFDQSFLDFFGSNGVAAVKSALQILNDLPPASQIVLTNYPFNSQQINFTAQSQNLYDLKSETLSLLLEQMGLAQPTRYIFVLKQWNSVFISDPSESQWPDGTIPNYIVQRNFDPQTFDASQSVNDTLYSGFVIHGSQNNVVPFPVDPNAINIAVADFNLNAGEFYTGLTCDDVGGLAYLFSTNNVNYENLLPSVFGIGVNSNSFVNEAWRPGVDKISFIPQPVDSQSGAFLPTTNYFTDGYITNGILQEQQMARVISQPDFIFSAGDVTSSVPAVLFFTRTGTTNWLNNAMANGNTNGAGPGVIQPQVQIVFNKLGRQFASVGSISDEQVSDQSQFWASFDNSINAPIVYPISQTGTNQMTIRMWLWFVGKTQKDFEWKPTSAAGSQFTLQTSTNLTSWINLFTVTNDSSVCTYFNENPASPSRFYRLIQQ
jgi:hypothetical protein